MESLKADYYDIVLCDIKMPNQSGDEVIAAFRHWETHNRPVTHIQPIYALSSHCDDPMRAKCRDAGMTGVLAKPMQIGLVVDIYIRHAREATQQWVCETCGIKVRGDRGICPDCLSDRSERDTDSGVQVYL